MNSSSEIWFDENGLNTIPQNIIANNFNIDNVIRLGSCPNMAYNRWDMTWLFMKSLTTFNRFGPPASRFNSFVIQSLNNVLPTIDNLLRRHPNLYDSWICHYCGVEPETLTHLLLCPALQQKWLEIEQATIHGLTDSCVDQDIIIPDSIEDILYTPSCFSTHGIHYRSTIQALSRGITPAYIFANMDIIGLKAHKVHIIGILLFQAATHFRDIIWKDRCKLHAEKEKAMNITSADKRNYSNNSRSIASRPPDIISSYQVQKNRWIKAIDLGADAMMGVIRQGKLALNNSWGICREYIGKNLKFKNNSRGSRSLS